MHENDENILRIYPMRRLINRGLQKWIGGYRNATFELPIHAHCGHTLKRYLHTVSGRGTIHRAYVGNSAVINKMTISGKNSQELI